MRSNLPPGVTDNMLPGNRPEDEAWDLLFDDMGGDCPDPAAARKRWNDSPMFLSALRRVEMMVDKTDHRLLDGHVAHPYWLPKRKFAEAVLGVVRTAIEAGSPCQCEGPEDASCPSCVANVIIAGLQTVVKCPQCGKPLRYVSRPGATTHYWHCDPCEVTWQRSGTDLVRRRRECSKCRHDAHKGRCMPVSQMTGKPVPGDPVCACTHEEDADDDS